MKIGDIVNKINFWPICEIKTIPTGSFQFCFTVSGFARLFFSPHFAFNYLYLGFISI